MTTEQRPIKFRAWDKKEKRMCPIVRAIFPYGFWGSNRFDIDAGYYRTPPDGDLKLRVGSLGDDFALMQYTGLDDENGEEIYEGDILRWVGKGNYLGGNVQLVIFKDCRILPLAGALSSKRWEVIGNIYENPELLKKTK